jgi:hypothetical protein
MGEEKSLTHAKISRLAGNDRRGAARSKVETLIGLLKEGRSVNTGIAIFRSTIDSQGNLSISVRVDKRITAAINVPGAFTGDVNNKANIGKSTEQFVQMWNEDHPEDQISNAPEPETPPFLRVN